VNSARLSEQSRWRVTDEGGHLLGEYDGTGALIQETVWLEDTPVATLRPKAGGGIDIDYVWADHLDTPRAITTSDAAATLLWSWNSDPFGTTAATGSIEYNLRFPGQYFDAETGLHYNYFRDYTASEGRYIENDPLGLFGGDNPYAYASLSPIQYVDAKGERFGAGAIGRGRQLEQDFGQYLKKQLPCGCSLKRNVYFRTPNKGRRFLDWVIFDQKNNPIEGFECKAGGSRYHASQRTKDNWISKTLGFPIRLIRR
jgi:RHS repeat-associated protein